jgi:hypothetical protein
MSNVFAACSGCFFLFQFVFSWSDHIAAFPGRASNTFLKSFHKKRGLGHSTAQTVAIFISTTPSADEGRNSI